MSSFINFFAPSIFLMGFVLQIKFQADSSMAKVTYSKQDEALEAVRVMDGKEIMKKRCEIVWITEKTVPIVKNEPVIEVKRL